MTELEFAISLNSNQLFQEDLARQTNSDYNLRFRISDHNSQFQFFETSTKKETFAKSKAQSQRIFYSDDDFIGQGPKQLNCSLQFNPGEVLHSTSEGHGFSSPEERSRSSPVEGKLKRNGEPQVNPSPAKNYIAFIWKKIKKSMAIHSEVTRSAWWKELLKMKPSLQLLTHLFTRVEAKPFLEKLFEGKYFLHEIMLSPIDAQKKKTYFGLLRVVRKGYKRGKIEWLR